VSGRSPWLAILLVAALAGALAEAGEASRPLRTRRNPIDGAEMILVGAGWFWMGSETGAEDESPRRRVYVDDFYIYRSEVTNAQFERFVRASGVKREVWRARATAARRQHPAVEVTGWMAAAYARWAGGRLPSEAEWEKAARGTDGRTYPWGNRWDRRRCNSDESGLRETAPVGSYPRGVSPYGVEDMAGNVWEWTSSDFLPYPGNKGQNDSFGRRYKVLRGGSWLYDPWQCRTTVRRGDSPSSDDGKPSYGVRCVLSP